METTLHQQLKDHFREPNSPIEVRIDRYRIDVINGDRLVEIQRSGLASIRKKIEVLLKQGFKVDVVKPIVRRKRLIKLDSIFGKEIDQRWSPHSGSIFDLFDELLYFTRTFPHPQLRIIAPLITIEEIRYPGHGRRRRKRDGDFIVQDRQILELHETYCFKSVSDLNSLLPQEKLPKIFGTTDLASSLSIYRHRAQQLAFVLRKTGALIETGKVRNAIQYRFATKKEAAEALATKRAAPSQLKQAKLRIKAALSKHQLKAA